jgi:hypothetical protein
MTESRPMTHKPEISDEEIEGLRKLVPILLADPEEIEPDGARFHARAQRGEAQREAAKALPSLLAHIDALKAVNIALIDRDKKWSRYTEQIIAGLDVTSRSFAIADRVIQFLKTLEQENSK